MPSPVRNCTFELPNRAVTHARTASHTPVDRRHAGRGEGGGAEGHRFEEDAMRFFERFGGRGGAADGAHALAGNDVLRLPRGRVLRVVTGRVVVTRAGDPEDHVLDAGAELDLAEYDRALAWALRPSRVELRRASAREDVSAEVALAR
jgi:hypothetical protein